MIFSVRDGCFSYQKHAAPEQDILKHITFEIGSGSILSILGPNGAGKTTLLRCMMGLLPWRQGKSELDGKNIRSFHPRELWQQIAYVPQAKSSIVSYSVEEMILLGRSSRFSFFLQPSRADREAVETIMEQLHITRLAGRSCSALSGGELQMVLMARALVSNPHLLILDEPESNLDFKNQLIVLDTMSALAEKGLTCIFNTHYPAHALQRAEKALLLDKRGHYLFGDTNEIVTEESIESAFGVKTVIGEIETDHRVYRDILPLHITAIDFDRPDTTVPESAGKRSGSHPADSSRMAILGILIEDTRAADEVNLLLHEYSSYIVGRMGMPYRPREISVINIILDAPEFVIRGLTEKLSRIRSISVKATYSKNRR